MELMLARAFVTGRDFLLLRQAIACAASFGRGTGFMMRPSSILVPLGSVILRPAILFSALEPLHICFFYASMRMHCVTP